MNEVQEMIIALAMQKIATGKVVNNQQKPTPAVKQPAAKAKQIKPALDVLSLLDAGEKQAKKH